MLVDSLILLFSILRGCLTQRCRAFLVWQTTQGTWPELHPCAQYNLSAVEFLPLFPLFFLTQSRSSKLRSMAPRSSTVYQSQLTSSCSIAIYNFCEYTNAPQLMIMTDRYDTSRRPRSSKSFIRISYAFIPTTDYPTSHLTAEEARENIPKICTTPEGN